MNNKPKSNSEGSIEDQAIALLAELVVGHAIEARNQAIDPFEEYAFGLQVKVFEEAENFPNDCILGYHALMQAAVRQKR